MPETVPVRRGREGSRWINERPSAEDVASWFKAMPLHDGMTHEKYVGGLTLIPAKEKGNEIVGYADSGLPIIAERENLTFTPYMKVETRVAYFWDYVAANRSEGWVGRIEPIRDPIVELVAEAMRRDVGVDPAAVEALLARARQVGLPPGYFAYQAHKPDGKLVTFVGYSARVSITGYIEGEADERVVLYEGTGTKIVATATRWDADINALMKAETGAVGRALGFAGMLVLPGSGVATAEDMQEALDHRGTGGVSPEDAALPGDEPATPATLPQAPQEPADGDPAMRRHAAEIIKELEAEHPAELEQFRTWAKGRGFGSLNELTSPALKGVVRKLEKTLDDAKTKAVSLS